MAVVKRRYASVTPPALSIKTLPYADDADPEETEEMSSFRMTQVASKASQMTQKRRSSLFEVPSMAAIRSAHRCGSSVMSFSQEPRIEEESAGRHKKIQFENTYRMEPAVKFVPDKVNRIIQEVLEDHLTGKTYEPLTCSVLCKTLSQEIKQRVKQLDFKRYKLISTVTIGQKKDGGVRHGSRCVWDQDRDNFASATFENAHLFATGVLYAVYFE